MNICDFMFTVTAAVSSPILIYNLHFCKYKNYQKFD